MKVQIEIDVPDDTTAQEVQAVIREFQWLARLRGWRMLLSLPRLRCKRKQQA